MEPEFIPCVICGGESVETDPILGPHCEVCFAVKARLFHFLSYAEGRKYTYKTLIELSDKGLVT